METQRLSPVVIDSKLATQPPLPHLGVQFPVAHRLLEETCQQNTLKLWPGSFPLITAAGDRIASLFKELAWGGQKNQCLLPCLPPRCSGGGGEPIPAGTTTTFCLSWRQRAPEPLGGPVKLDCWVPPPESDSGGLGWGPKICISDKFPNSQCNGWPKRPH